MFSESVGTPFLWAGFIGFVIVMLAIDLGLFHRKAHEVSLKEAGIWSAVWVALALLFNLGVYFLFGSEQALEFTTGYLIEKALAVDNLFVFVVIFLAFGIPAVYQHKVLFWGVLGALITRAIFIMGSGVLLRHFHWAMYAFGAVLAFTGVKLLVRGEGEVHPERNPLVRLFQKLVPVKPGFAGGAFTVVEGGRRYGTSLLVALAAIELTDVIFAVDSIPAVFAVTEDPFIVFTSNIFAILGLRSMYFLLAGVMSKLEHLKTGLAVVLVFVGAKMLLADVVHVPIGASLGVIVGILALSVLPTFLRRPRRPPSQTRAARDTVRANAARRDAA
jgi:tellurite resistance protein TerC